jgi:poly(A) polymerase
MKLAPAKWQASAGMRRLLAALDVRAGTTRFVGGCVRDTLLGLEVSDVDLATRLDPGDVIERLLRARLKAIPTGLAHGTVTALIGGGARVEITTLRRDVATDGRRALIAYTGDWREDAARRDFTINALSADPESLEIHDYFGGLDDLEARRVRFIGDPLIRIAEDHLRILRFFRFHARFGRGAPDPGGLEACAARAGDLKALSRERIADELLKLLALPDPGETMRLMVEREILAPLLPEIGAAGVARLGTLIGREKAAGAASDPLRRLGALLPPDAGLATEIASRLRLSNVFRKRLTCILGRGDEDPGDPLVSAYWHGPACAIDRLLLCERIDPAEARRRIRRLSGWQKPKLPVTGGMLIERGLPPGPVIARTLQAIERDWVDRGFPDGAALAPLVEAKLAQAWRESQ